MHTYNIERGDPGQVVVLGRSLGSGTAMRLAKQARTGRGPAFESSSREDLESRDESAVSPKRIGFDSSKALRSHALVGVISLDSPCEYLMLPATVLCRACQSCFASGGPEALYFSRILNSQLGHMIQTYRDSLKNTCLFW